MKHLVIFLGMTVGCYLVESFTDRDWDEAFRITLVQGIAILLCYLLT